MDSNSYAISSILFSGHTRFQAVCIADTEAFGRALFLDGLIQSAAADEALYHQLLVQPAMIAHPCPIDVLIIGSGEGAGLREVLAHASVSKAVMVDIDGELVTLCRKHLTQWHSGSFEDPRAVMIAADASTFVALDRQNYDVIVVDLTDMIAGGLADDLYSPAFFRSLKQRLRPGGIVAVQGLALSLVDYTSHTILAGVLRSAFTEVHSYGEYIPSFQQYWGFLLASDWCRPREWSARDIDGVLSDRLNNHTLEISGEYLKGRFAFPQRLMRILSARPSPCLGDKNIDPIEDAN